MNRRWWRGSPRGGLRARALLGLLALGVMVGLVGAPSAQGAVSYYRALPLEAATTYDSNQRNDWKSNFVYNDAFQNITARWWMYNVTTSSYILQSGDQLILAQQARGDNFSYPSSQSAKNYCRRVSGGADTPGKCAGVY